MTYEKIQAKYLCRYKHTVKSCWIAEVKRKQPHINVQPAPNRKGKPKVKCPEHVFPKLEALMKEMGEI